VIGSIAGRVDYRGSDHVLIDVGGVGYVVHVSDRTLAALPGAGEAAALYTELIVRQDLLQLVGFQTLLEKEWYRTLTSVQGIGTKAAMGILGTLGAEATGRAIALGDWASIKAAPGVGPKIAQRVVNELKDKAPAVMALGGMLGGMPGGPITGSDEVIDAGDAPAPTRAAPSASAQAEAMSALGNLGYGPAEAATAVAEAAGAMPEADTPTLIRAALRRLAPKG